MRMDRLHDTDIHTGDEASMLLTGAPLKSNETHLLSGRDISRSQTAKAILGM
jgi:hypothetical protein